MLSFADWPCASLHTVVVCISFDASKNTDTVKHKITQDWKQASIKRGPLAGQQALIERVNHIFNLIIHIRIDWRAVS